MERLGLSENGIVYVAIEIAMTSSRENVKLRSTIGLSRLTGGVSRSARF